MCDRKFGHEELTWADARTLTETCSGDLSTVGISSLVNRNCNNGPDLFKLIAA